MNSIYNLSEWMNIPLSGVLSDPINLLGYAFNQVLAETVEVITKHCD